MKRIVIRLAVVAAVALSAGWTSAYGYIPGEALILPAAIAVATPVAIARCAMETNPPVGSIRARRNLGVWEREGLAVSRVLASPLNVLLAPCGMNYVNCTKKDRPVFDKVATTPAVFVASVLYGACGTVTEICVGMFEMLTTMKVNQVYYPWETDRVSCDDMDKLLTPNLPMKKSE